MPKVPNLNTAYRHYRMPRGVYGPTREDALRWNEFLEREAERRRFVPDAIRAQYIASKNFRGMDPRETRSFQYDDPFTGESVQFEGTEADYWRNLQRYMPEGDKWFHHSSYDMSVPYERSLLPEELEMLPEEYGDYNLRGYPLKFRKYYEDNPLPPGIYF